MEGLRWLGTARILSQLITWGLTTFTVRLLHPRDYGIVAMAGLFTVLATLLFDGGLNVILVNRRELPEEVQGAAATGVLLSGSILAAVLVLIAPAGASFFKTPTLTVVLRVAALQLPLTAISVVPQALLLREMSFDKIAKIQTITSVAQGTACLAMAFYGLAYWSLICGTLFGTAVRGTLSWASLGSRPAFNLRVRELRPLLPSSSHMIGQRLLYFVSGNFDTFLLSRFLGPATLGSYNLAGALSHSVFDQLSATINQVTLPAFATKSGEAQAEISGLIAMISVAATVVFPLFWFMGVISQTAFPFMFGHRWDALIFPFLAFAAIMPLRILYAFVDTAIVGIGRTSTSFRNMIVWACIMMPLLFIGASFGANTTALAWTVGFPLVFAGAIFRISRKIKVSASQLLYPLTAPAACAAVSCAVVESTELLLRGSLGPIPMLIVEIVTAALCYWLLIRQFGNSHYLKTKGLMYQLLGQRGS